MGVDGIEMELQSARTVYLKSSFFDRLVFPVKGGIIALGWNAVGVQPA